MDGQPRRLHDASLEITRAWDLRAWITCALTYRGRRLPLLEVHEGVPAQVVGDHVLPWQRANTYGPPVGRPRTGTATVLTPPTSLAALAAGYLAGGR